MNNIESNSTWKFQTVIKQCFIFCNGYLYYYYYYIIILSFVLCVGEPFQGFFKVSICFYFGFRSTSPSPFLFYDSRTERKKNKKKTFSSSPYLIFTAGVFIFCVHGFQYRLTHIITLELPSSGNFMGLMTSFVWVTSRLIQKKKK